MRRVWMLAAIGVALSVASPAEAEIIYGMTASGTGSSIGTGLVRFDSFTPGSVASLGAFSGVNSGHSVRSIDFRPATGELYAISNDAATGKIAQLYKVNLATAALSPVGSSFMLGLNGSTRVSMEFNPVDDRIRILISEISLAGATNNNFRAHPDTGALVSIDTNLAYAAGDPQAGEPTVLVTGAAYDNNNPGATTATLYAWDAHTDSLATIGNVGAGTSPDTGQMFTIHTPATPYVSGAAMDMDISGASGVLFVTHDNFDASMSLFVRNVITGSEVLIGPYAPGVIITDISVQPVPEPAGLVLCALGAVALLRFGRRQASRAKDLCAT